MRTAPGQRPPRPEQRPREALRKELAAIKTTLLSAVAAIGLSLGALGTAQARTPGPDLALDSKPQIAEARCFYQYAYAWNGYGYAYVYRYICY